MLGRSSCPSCRVVGRRALLGLLVAGAVIGLSDTTAGERSTVKPGEPRPRTVIPRSIRPVTAANASPPEPVVQLNSVPPPHPGSPRTVSAGLPNGRRIAITIDDGFCVPCSEYYVALAQQTGIHLTLSPNGVYGPIWEPLAPLIRPLIENGQVQIGNHTYNHYNLLALSDTAVEDQIHRNEEWIQATFGITARPWFRPPYGAHDARTDDIAGQLGYTNIVMWNGTFGDSTPISPKQLLNLANEYLKPGTIMLGHANRPTIEPLWGQIQGIIAARGLVPVTLDEMFGTSRNHG